MRQSVELYFLMNFAVDTALMAIVARANGCLRTKRTLLGGFLAASYALLVKMVSPRLAHPAIQIALAVPIGLIVCGDPSPRHWGPMLLQFLCGALMLGGIGLLSSARSQLTLMIWLSAGLFLLNGLLNARTRRVSSWEVNVCLQFRGQCVSFQALIDTGNRLREPISGLPVLIAESSLLQGLLRDEKDRPVAYRRIAFGALGGGGTIQCFRPDSILIRRGDSLIPAPEVWVAVYPGKMPGASRALAPPSFALIPGKT